MPFTLESDTLLIRGRKGDTASFTFNFNKDISDYTVYFYVLRNIYSADPVIQKKYEKPAGTSITVNLTIDDTALLTPLSNSYNTYYWGVKITNGSDFAQTVIPQEFKNPPMMYIYPEIGGK